MSKTKSEPPESSPQTSADDSGEFQLDPKSLSADTLPLLPMLKKSVSHMRKSNEHVKATNQELIKLNRNQGIQNRWLRAISLLLTVFLGVLGFGMWLDHQDSKALTLELEKTNIRLDRLVVEADETKRAAEDTKRAVEEKPSIIVKTDASGVPTAVVVEAPVKPPTHKHIPKPKGDPPPPAPVGIEFPLGPPMKMEPKK